PRPLDRQRLDPVDVLATAIVALAGVAFRVLVGEDRTLGFEHARARIVLGGDELDVLFLAPALAFESLGQLRVEAFDHHGGAEHARAFTRSPVGRAKNCTGTATFSN